MSESILSRLTTVLRGSFAGQSLDHLGRDVERRAERIHENTQLSRAEAVVVAADTEGHTTEEIGVSVGKSDRTIERIRRRVRKQYRGLDGENTGEVLSDWADARDLG